jgi:hypothetical protein
MHVIDDISSAEREEAAVLEWRFTQLRRNGFDDEIAQVLAASHDVDLHRALDLVARGCPPPLAGRILL